MNLIEFNLYNITWNNNECKKKNNNLHIVNNSDISNYSFDEEFQHFNYKDLKNLSINLKKKQKEKKHKKHTKFIKHKIRNHNI